MKRELHIVICLVLSVLVISTPTAANPTVTISDSASGGWAQTSVHSGDVSQDSNNNYHLTRTTVSHGTSYIVGSNTNGGATSGRLSVGSSGINENNQYNRLARHSTDNIGFIEYRSGGAYRNGNHYFIDSADAALGQNAYLYRWDEDGTKTQIFNFGVKALSGAAYIGDSCSVTDNNGNEIDILAGDSSDENAINADFATYSFVDNGGGQIADGNGKEWNIWGIAPAGGCKAWVVDDTRGRILRLDFGNPPNIQIELSYPRPSGDLHGLAYNDQTGRFYSQDVTNDELVMWEYSSGNVVNVNRRSTESGTALWVGAVDEGDGENFNHGKFTLYDMDNGNVYEHYTEDLTYGTGAQWESDWFNPSSDQGDGTVQVSYTFEGNQLWGSYGASIYIKERGQSWDHKRSITVQNDESFTKTFTHAVDTAETNEEFKLRITLNPGQHHGLINGQAPKVTSVSFDYHYYQDSGVVRGHSATSESEGIDLSDVYQIKWLNVSGSSGEEPLAVDVVNSNGNVIHTINGALGENHISGAWDETKPANQEVFLDFEMTSDGTDSPEVSGWNFDYVPRGPDPSIEDWHVNDGGSTIFAPTTDYSTAIGNTSSYHIDSVNQSVDEVRWYVNGVLVTTKTGPDKFTFSRSWEASDTGINSVVGEVFNDRNGTDSVEWQVEIPTPDTVQMASIDIIEDSVPSDSNLTKSYKKTVDFPGTEQTIDQNLGTRFDVVVDPGNENATYDVTMMVNGPIDKSKTWNDVTGKQVLTGSDSFAQSVVKNFDGRYTFDIVIHTNAGTPTTSYDVRSVFTQQVGDTRSIPELSQISISEGAHLGEEVSIGAQAHSEITSMKDVWVHVVRPDGTEANMSTQHWLQGAGRTVDYSDSLTFNEIGQYHVTFKAENYDSIIGSSTTYVVSVTNSPPVGRFQKPPTQIHANRSFTLNWNVTDPEGDAVSDTGIILTSPNGNEMQFDDDTPGAGEHSLTIGPGNVTEPGLWSIQSYQVDDEGQFGRSDRVVVEVVSLQEYSISNVTIKTFNGTETAILDAGRNVTIEGKITPDVSSNVNGTAYVNLETQSGALVSELYTATSVEFQNATTVSLSEINNGTPVTELIPPGSQGEYVLEIGVVSEAGDSSFRVPVSVKGLTTGSVEETTINRQEAFPPEFITVVSSVVNDGEQATSYNYTVSIRQNGTTFLTESANTTALNPGNGGSAGIGFQLPHTLKPGEYTVRVELASANVSEWEVFDSTSLLLRVAESPDADIDRVDLGYESGVVQGFVTVENSGNIPLQEGDLQILVIDSETDRRESVRDISVDSIPVGGTRQKTVNFNFSADDNSTYFVGLRYSEANVTDDTFTQFATGMRPSMEIVDIDGPSQVIQGENATYRITVKNNGDVNVNSTSFVVSLQTRQGTTVAEKARIIDTTYQGQQSTFTVELPFRDPALLGQSKVVVTGQASTNNQTLTTLPREEEVFVSAPGFIISGDSSFSDLNPGDTITITESFLVVGRPGAAIDVQIRWEDSVELISGRPNQTLTSGSAASWTFIVEEPINGKPIRILATSGTQSQAKDISVATTGTSGLLGDIGDGLPDSYDELFPNTYMATLLPSYPDSVHYLLQWIVVVVFVFIIEFGDFSSEWSMYQKHGSAAVAAGWFSGFMPTVMVLLTAAWGVGLYIEYRSPEAIVN